jgi:hypothetical protein
MIRGRSLVQALAAGTAAANSIAAPDAVYDHFVKFFTA